MIVLSTKMLLFPRPVACYFLFSAYFSNKLNLDLDSLPIYNRQKVARGFLVSQKILYIFTLMQIPYLGENSGTKRLRKLLHNNPNHLTCIGSAILSSLWAGLQLVFPFTSNDTRAQFKSNSCSDHEAQQESSERDDDLTQICYWRKLTRVSIFLRFGMWTEKKEVEELDPSSFPFIV